MGCFQKFLHLVISVACLGLHYKTMNAEFDPKMSILITGTFFAYTIISAVLMTGELMSKPGDKTVDSLFCIVGSLLFFGVGFIVLQDWENGFNAALKTEKYNEAVTKGGLAIGNGILLLLNVWC